MKTLLPILKTKLFILGFILACTAILANNYIQRDNPFKFSGTKEEKVIAKPEKVFVKTKKPADKKINLQIHVQGEYVLALYDQQGRIVFNKIVSGPSSLLISLPGNMAPGIYFLSLINGKTVLSTERIILH